MSTVEERSGGVVERVERLERNAEALRDEVRGLKHELLGRSPGPRPVPARDAPPQEAPRRPPVTDKLSAAAQAHVQAPARVSRRPPASGRMSEKSATVRERSAPKPSAAPLEESGTKVRRFRLPFALGDLGDFRSGEWWLGRIGIALLLFGVCFLYLLSEERGWITPPMRVGFGLVLGATLVALGLRVYGERRSFAQLLLGGGIGSFYATGYAAYAFYALVPHAVAFAFMAAVTALAFSFSVRQNTAALALIGTFGGLGTPFVLDDGSGSPVGLVLYACTVLAGAAAIYLHKGWVSLLSVSLSGGWLVLSAGLLNAHLAPGGPDTVDRYALQTGTVFVWAAFWITSALREALLSRGSALVLRPPGSPSTGSVASNVVSVTSPLLAIALTQAVWSPQEQVLGFVALGFAVAHALAAPALARLGSARHGISYIQTLVALLLLTLALVLVLGGDALLFALAAEAAVLHVVARRFRDRVVSAAAHLLSAAAGLWVLLRVLPASAIEPYPQSLANAASLTDLAVIALAFAASGNVTPASGVRLYRVLAHGLALGWLAGELLPLAQGDSLTLLAWALYASVLHLLSRRRSDWGLGSGTHAVSAAVALWLAARIVGGAVTPGYPGAPVLNAWGLADLAVIASLAIAGLMPGAVSPPRHLARYYALAAHVALLAWLWRELSAPSGGEAYVTVAWGLYAVALLVAGLRLDRVPLFRGGMTTLFLVVGKLFLVDLASIEAVWRVLLFLGFGALFLALSFYTRSLWRPNRSGTTPNDS